jgi:thermostable 8-oxoguanine DNA glycosylase
MGKYKLYNKAFRAAVNIDLDSISVESLEKVPGIGPKTARMTAMYGFPDTAGEVAVLDTHILKWLRLKGYDAPKSTPQAGKRYLQLEQAFIAEAKKRSMSSAELDTSVWKSYASI